MLHVFGSVLIPSLGCCLLLFVPDCESTFSTIGQALDLRLRLQLLFALVHQLMPVGPEAMKHYLADVLLIDKARPIIVF